MGVDQHNDNEGKLRAAEGDENIEYDGEESDDELLSPTRNQRRISVKVRTLSAYITALIDFRKPSRRLPYEVLPLIYPMTAVIASLTTCT